MPTPLWQCLFNEAASGTAPASIVDTSAGTAVNLTPSYGTGAAWTSIAAGRGLGTGTHAGSGEGVNATLLVSSALNGTKIATALNGATAYTIELVINVPAGAATGGGTIMVIAPTDLADSGLGDIYKAASAHTWEFYFPGGVSPGWTNAAPTAGTTTVVHSVVDTTQATQANRFRLYYGGSAQTPTLGAGVAQNTTATVDATRYIALCDARDRGWCTTATIYYAAIYASALTAGECAANATALAAANDADPNATGGGASTFRRLLLGVGF